MISIQLKNIRNDCISEYSLPDRPQSEQDTISSGFPLFLFSAASPKQKSQYGEACTRGFKLSLPFLSPLLVGSVDDCCCWPLLPLLGLLGVVGTGFGVVVLGPLVVTGGDPIMGDGCEVGGACV